MFKTKKGILSFILAICLVVPAMFMLSACGAEKSVVGSWETYQMIVPAEKEGDQDTIVNVGEEFKEVVLSKDTFELTLEDDMSLKFTQTVGSMSMKANSTYTNNNGVYFAELIIQLGGDEHTLYLQFVYDNDNDRISCALQEKDVEIGEYTTAYTVIFSRANG
ncbi:MAG: hypothetical protein ACI4TZ_03980 [Christensenellales bacterium]